MIFLVGSFVFTHIPAFWPMPTIFLGATAAASAIGFINMVGNLGGFVGPVIAGSSADKDASSMATALRNLSPWALIGRRGFWFRWSWFAAGNCSPAGRNSGREL